MSAQTHFICNHTTACYSSKCFKDYIKLRLYTDIHEVNCSLKIAEELLSVTKQYLDYLNHFTISCTCIPTFIKSIQILETYIEDIKNNI